MKNKTLTIVQHILVIAVAFFTLNGLSFSLTQVSSARSDSGFLMLSNLSFFIGRDFAWGLYLIRVLSWLQFLFSLAAIALGIISIFMKESARKAVGMLVLIGSVAFCFLYMLEGIIETVLCKNGYSDDEFVTTAFIPFLLNTVLMITYFIIPNLAKNTMYAVDQYHGYENDGDNGVYKTTVNAPLDREENTGNVKKSTASAKKDIDSVVFYVKSYIPDEKVMSFRNTLTKSEASDLSFISMIPLKNPTTTLLFSIFLGGLGVDRFYIGDTGVGVAKLLLSSFTLGIWPLVDIFLCYKKAKELNYYNLLARLNHHN